MANTFRNNDEIAHGCGHRIGAGDHDHVPFEDVELVVCIGMEVHSGATGDIDVVFVFVSQISATRIATV